LISPSKAFITALLLDRPIFGRSNVYRKD